MPPAPVVVLDACVLYPAQLRDLLMRLAVHGLIQAKWSDEIHEEWITAVLRERPDLSREKLQRTRDLMDKHAADSLVTGYERHLASLSLPDPDDRHVLAAAIESQATMIVTWNLKDFPASYVAGHSIEICTPEELLTRLLASDFIRVIEVMREHRASLKNPPKTASEYLETLRQQGLNKAVSAILSSGDEV